MTEAEWDLGGWLSAALDDPSACQEFKDDIVAWFEEVAKREANKVDEDRITSQIRLQAFLDAARLLLDEARHIQNETVTKE